MFLKGKFVIPLLSYNFWTFISLLCLRWKLKWGIHSWERDISVEQCHILFLLLVTGGWEDSLRNVRMAVWNIFWSTPSKQIISISSMLKQDNKEVRALCKMISVSFHPIQPSQKLVLHPPTPLKWYVPFNVHGEEQGEDKRWKRRTVITVGPKSYSVFN